MKCELLKGCVPAGMMSLFMLVAACGGKNGEGKGFPDGFQALSDEQKVVYMMQHVPADSVARFIIYASLGKVEGVRIDTLNNATLKAYETYMDTALQSFSWEFDRVAEELPLHDKMRLRALVGSEDPQGLGLTLGLEYMNQIRVKGMTAEQVLAELSELKKACADDPDTYARFIIGFRTVLRHDKNSDMPAEIYSRFLNFDDDAVQEYYRRNKAASKSTTVTDSIGLEDNHQSAIEASAAPSDSIN